MSDVSARRSEPINSQPVQSTGRELPADGSDYPSTSRSSQIQDYYEGLIPRVSPSRPVTSQNASTSASQQRATSPGANQSPANQQASYNPRSNQTSEQVSATNQSNRWAAHAHADEYDSPLREDIKIVVVGDSGTGKSKLVYSQACRRTFSEKELSSCYVPTIWAIDQYKHRKDVQELAQCCIDGAYVTVRIWDTFGDHSKDRNFAYQNADVVVLCFSLCNRTSMLNAQSRWLKEIQHFLKNIPVVLAGTMLDMRWKDLKRQSKRQSRFNKVIKASDIITPDEARDVCETVGLPYYESTVLTGHGVKDIFENAIRAALIYRRSSRLYTMNHLRKVREPLLQAPCLPPEPPYPELPPVVQSTYVSDMAALSVSEETADVVLCCGSSKFFCHKLILVQSSGLFSLFFEQQALMQNVANELSDTGTDSDLDSEHNGENRDTSASDLGGVKRSELFLNGHPILKMTMSDFIFEKEDPDHSDVRGDPFVSSSNCALQVSVHGDIPRNHLSAILHYMYHLQLPQKSSCSHIELIQTAKLFKMPELANHLRNTSLTWDHAITGSYSDTDNRNSVCGGGWVTRSKLSVQNNINYVCSYNSSSSLNSCSSSSENNLPNITCSRGSNSKYSPEVERFVNATKRQEFFKREFFNQQMNHTGNFAFRTEDDTIWVHKYLLVARSKFMASLFCGHFKESQGHEMEVSDISSDAMKVVLGYLYCDQILFKVKDLDISDWCDVIEFANRLCLDRLISLVEHELLLDLKLKNQPESVKDCILLIDKCSLFNAHAIHKWLFTHMCHNYDFMCKNFSYLKQTMLTEDTKLELLRNRWPPVWYIKEKDYYERRKRLMSKIESDKRQMKNGMRRWWLWRKQNVL